MKSEKIVAVSVCLVISFFLCGCSKDEGANVYVDKNSASSLETETDKPPIGLEGAAKSGSNASPVAPQTIEKPKGRGK